MDREQRRKFTKQMKAKGYSEKPIEIALALQGEKPKIDIFDEGDKVKLNTSRIKSHPDYSKNIDFNKQNYHNFIDANDGKVFTVEYDPKHTNNPTLFCLKEDETDPKWLWWTGDLIKVEID